MLAFVYIGKELTFSYYKKLNYNRDMKNFFEFCRTNINYNNLTFENIVNKYEFKSNQLKEDINIFLKTRENHSDGLLGDFLQEIGKKDKNETLVFFDKCIKDSQKIIENMEKKEKQSGILPLKLCIAIGVATCIIFI